MDTKLNGIYRISFDIKLTDGDKISSSDLSFLLAEGIGETLSEKVSNLDIQKIEKQGTISNSNFKIGDMVSLKNDIKIKASIYNDDGYYFVGTPTEISEFIDEPLLDLKAGLIGYVNRVIDNKVEVVELDQPISKYAELDIEFINVDLIQIDAELLEKVVNEEEK